MLMTWDRDDIANIYTPEDEQSDTEVKAIASVFEALDKGAEATVTERLQEDRRRAVVTDPVMGSMVRFMPPEPMPTWLYDDGTCTLNFKVLVFNEWCRNVRAVSDNWTYRRKIAIPFGLPAEVLAAMKGWT